MSPLNVRFLPAAARIDRSRLSRCNGQVAEFFPEQVRISAAIAHLPETLASAAQVWVAAVAAGMQRGTEAGKQEGITARPPAPRHQRLPLRKGDRILTAAGITRDAPDAGAIALEHPQAERKDPPPLMHQMPLPHWPLPAAGRAELNQGTGQHAGAEHTGRPVHLRCIGSHGLQQQCSGQQNAQRRSDQGRRQWQWWMRHRTAQMVPAHTGGGSDVSHASTTGALLRPRGR